MPRPKALGNTAAAIVAESCRHLKDSQQALYDTMDFVAKGDKDAAKAALKGISANNMIAFEALLLLRADKIHEAEQLLLDSK